MFGQNIFERAGGCASHAVHLWMSAEQEMGDARTGHGLRLEDFHREQSLFRKESVCSACCLGKNRKCWTISVEEKALSTRREQKVVRRIGF